MGRSKNNIKTKRITLRISIGLNDYLEKLAQVGIHGKNGSEVAEHFLEEAIGVYLKDDIVTKVKALGAPNI
ncbi:MAG TPA: hypothetical protein VN653_04785 [Anaerolineales bacterium]|nr:hypothetical protein [Anaerolineales bacterium]